MPIQLNEENGGKLINVRVSGKLEKADYEHFVPEFERLARQHGKLRVLFDMTGFHGWEASAAWEDFKFGMKHHVRHRADRDGRGKALAARHGDLLQAVHQSRGPLLRSRRRR